MARAVHRGSELTGTRHLGIEVGMGSARLYHEEREPTLKKDLKIV